MWIPVANINCFSRLKRERERPDLREIFFLSLYISLFLFLNPVPITVFVSFLIPISHSSLSPCFVLTLDFLLPRFFENEGSEEKIFSRKSQKNEQILNFTRHWYFPLLFN